MFRSLIIAALFLIANENVQAGSGGATTVAAPDSSAGQPKRSLNVVVVVADDAVAPSETANLISYLKRGFIAYTSAGLARSTPAKERDDKSFSCDFEGPLSSRNTGAANNTTSPKSTEVAANTATMRKQVLESDPLHHILNPLLNHQSGIIHIAYEYGGGFIFAGKVQHIPTPAFDWTQWSFRWEYPPIDLGSYWYTPVANWRLPASTTEVLTPVGNPAHMLNPYQRAEWLAAPIPVSADGSLAEGKALTAALKANEHESAPDQQRAAIQQPIDLKTEAAAAPVPARAQQRHVLLNSHHDSAYVFDENGVCQRRLVETKGRGFSSFYVWEKALVTTQFTTGPRVMITDVESSEERTVDLVLPNPSPVYQSIISRPIPVEGQFLAMTSDVIYLVDIQSARIVNTITFLPGTDMGGTNKMVSFYMPTPFGYYLGMKHPSAQRYEFFRLPIATFGKVDDEQTSVEAMVNH